VRNNIFITRAWCEWLIYHSSLYVEDDALRSKWNVTYAIPMEFNVTH